MEQVPAPTAEDRARRRAKYLSGLLWHAGTFLIVNGFFWLLDLTVGEAGAQWAFWVTGVWGLALAFHALAYLIDGRQVEERRYQRYLEEEHRREHDEVSGEHH